MIKNAGILSILCISVLTASAATNFTPVWDGAYRTTALDIALDGDEMWVATSWGVALYDASGAELKVIRTIPLEGATTSVVLSTTRVYVGSGSTVFVLSRDRNMTILGTGTTSGTINDLLLLEPYLYAATSEGVVQLDLVQPDSPSELRKLSTSTGLALNLTVLGTTLYAADGDFSIEAYTVELPSFPQQIGSFDVLPRAQAVNEAAGRLYVSDGQRTEIWFGSGTQVSLAGVIPAGGRAVVPVGSQFVWVAGDDRRLRAFDVTSASAPVELFVSAAAQVGGTVNRFLDLALDGSTIYVAAGDAGLQVWTAEGFSEPYLLRVHDTGTGGSVAAYQGGTAASLENTGLSSYTISSAGELSQVSAWDFESQSTVLDASDSQLLVRTGSSLRAFDLTQSPPSLIGSVQMPTTIREGLFVNGLGVAVLSNQTVWSADFGSGQSSEATPMSTAPFFLARGGGDVAFADINDDGTTTVRLYLGGNLASTPSEATIEGVASSGITLSENRLAAAVTFRGITLVDFLAGGSVSVVPGSNTAIARDVLLSGTTLFLLTTSTLQVWDVEGMAMEREVLLEGTGMAVAYDSSLGSAVVATSEGLTTVQFETGSPQPTISKTEGGSNVYYETAVMGERLFHVFDGRDIAIVPLDSSGMPGPPTILKPSIAAIDLAAVGERVYLLDPTGLVGGYTVDGRQISTYRVDESADQRILSMTEVAGALWISVEVNCLSGACELRTLVLDPRQGLTKTSTLPGGAVAATSAGATAWAVFDVPDEVRVVDTSDPYHPSVTGSTAATGNPVAIVRDEARGAVYVLGDLLYVYSDSNLTKLGELLSPYENDPSGRVGYIDQNVQVVGDSAVITGREFNPMVFTLTSPTGWSSAPRPGSGAAAVISSSSDGKRIYLLSDYSLEIWSAGDTTPRRRPIR